VDRVGKGYRLRKTGVRVLVCDWLPSPNVLVLDRSEPVLHVSITRSNQVMGFPLTPEKGGSPRARLFLQLSGGLIGPDGMAMDETGNLFVVHAGSGTVWQFSEHGEPLSRIRSCAGLRTTNVAFGGADRQTLFITEAQQGVILAARMTAPGRVVYGLS